MNVALATTAVVQDAAARVAELNARLNEHSLVGFDVHPNSPNQSSSTTSSSLFVDGLPFIDANGKLISNHTVFITAVQDDGREITYAVPAEYA